MLSGKGEGETERESLKVERGRTEGVEGSEVDTGGADCINKSPSDATLVDHAYEPLEIQSKPKK